MPGGGETWSAIWLTVVLALSTTVLLLLIGTPVAWALARTRGKWREPVAALIALPLVLPPTVIGFYLLIAFGPSGPGGSVAELWGGRTLAFSFPGLLLGSMIYSLPFMLQPLRVGFEGVRADQLEAATTLGASPWQRFIRVSVPEARSGFITGIVMCFAHTIGEFGVVLMIGGNIPGQTRVISIAIYNFVEQGDWITAHWLSLGMVIFAFIVVLVTMLADSRFGRLTG